MSVKILEGDCLSVMPTLEPDSIDAVVTDPPYHLTAGKKGGSGEASVNASSPAGRARVGTGFMGKRWDGGDVAFRSETWAEALRVAKPGAHLVAFGGTRTFHRLAVAIEDAGWEIRDTLSWLYGSGFPKSLDVSKAIDKRPGVTRHAEFAAHLRERMTASGFTNTFDVAEKVVGRRTGAVANWQKYQWPEAKWWPSLRDVLGLDEKWGSVIAEAEREKTGERDATLLAVAPGQGADRGAVTLDITTPNTSPAKKWEGWGTALKPAWEPIILARKPFKGTVAENVQQHGTAALNIDGCRIATEAGANLDGGRISSKADGWDRPWKHDVGALRAAHERGTDAVAKAELLGRWPANLILDEESAAMLDEQSGTLTSGARSGARYVSKFQGTYGAFNGGVEKPCEGSEGGASRFFYTAKASRSEREAGLEGMPERRLKTLQDNGGDFRTGSGMERSTKAANHHPTVKPLDLMQWLCRLVTPPGGLILDPFCGSGSTGRAAVAEGFSFIGIEKEPEYAAIARARIADYAPLFHDPEAA